MIARLKCLLSINVTPMLLNLIAELCLGSISCCCFCKPGVSVIWALCFVIIVCLILVPLFCDACMPDLDKVQLLRFAICVPSAMVRLFPASTS